MRQISSSFPNVKFAKNLWSYVKNYCSFSYNEKILKRRGKENMLTKTSNSSQKVLDIRERLDVIRLSGKAIPNFSWNLLNFYCIACQCNLNCNFMAHPSHLPYKGVKQQGHCASSTRPGIRPIVLSYYNARYHTNQGRNLHEIMRRKNAPAAGKTLAWWGLYPTCLWE